jgi:hypothetical protein
VERFSAKAGKGPAMRVNPVSSFVRFSQFETKKGPDKFCQALFETNILVGSASFELATPAV